MTWWSRRRLPITARNCKTVGARRWKVCSRRFREGTCGFVPSLSLGSKHHKSIRQPGSSPLHASKTVTLANPQSNDRAQPRPEQCVPFGATETVRPGASIPGPGTPASRRLSCRLFRPLRESRSCTRIAQTQTSPRRRAADLGLNLRAEKCRFFLDFFLFSGIYSTGCHSRGLC